MELDSSKNEMLPKNPPDQEPDSVKQLKLVQETVKQLPELTVAERSTLDEMIRTENAGLMEAVKRSLTPHDLATNLLALVRAKANASMDMSPDSPTQPATPSSPPAAAHPLQSEIDLAIKKMSFQKPPVLKSSLTAVQTHLRALESHPDESKKRKLRTDNVAFKKQVIDVPGAQTLFELVGFKLTEHKEPGKDKAIQYLEIEREAVKSELINLVLESVQNRLSGKTPEEVKAPTPSGKKLPCAGGCGFWGDENTENLCSVCHKKKYFGVKAPDPKVAPGPKAKDCTKGCGFYGVEKFRGMCSKCFAVSGEQPLVLPKTRKAKWKSAKLKLTAVRAFMMVAKRPKQVNKSRCWSCNKRIGTTESAGIECKCLYIFCSAHRMPNDHDCPFDFKKQYRKKLEKENKSVNHKKFDTIEES